MIAQQVAGKAIRDSLFLSLWPAENLPLVMAASAAFSVIVVLGFTRLVVRHSPARVVPALFAIHALIYAGEWALAGVDAGIAAVSVYLHSTAVGATVISGFWSVINERFDPHTAKRFISRIAGGATAGGVVGGIVAWQAGQVLELSTMLIVLTGANLACAFGIRRASMASGGAGRRGHDLEAKSGWHVMRDVPYLRHVALLVVTATMVEACVDYVFKAEAKAAFSAPQLITFFSIFHAVVSTVTFALQTGLARHSLQRLGLTGTVASLPVTNIVGAVVALLVPGAWPLAALRGATMAVENSLYRSGYELLYTPLTALRKRPTKTLIDVGADRLGSVLGSVAALLVIWGAPHHVRLTLLVAAVAMATLSIVVAGLLHRGYVAALADSLRAGSLTLNPELVADSTTRRTLTDTAMALDRQRLLEQIAVLREEASASGRLPAVAGAGPEKEGRPGPEPMDRAGPDPVVDEVAAAVAALRSGHVKRVRQVFADFRADYPAELVPSTIELLARDDLHHQVIEILRRIAPLHIGQLCDALLDPTVDFAIRRRVPRVLSHCATQRSVDGLLAALKDGRFEVRYRSGLALFQITAKLPGLHIDREQILAAALAEAERGEHVWRSQKLLDTSFDEGEGPFLDGSDRVGKSLEHVFTILSLVLEREPLQLAYRALAMDDETLRGTGLEYLENVVPGDIRAALWPYLGDRRVVRGSPRARDLVVKDLFDSMSSVDIDVAAIRREAARKDD